MKRTRECLTCHHVWDGDVKYGPTQMLTGEITPDCPRCGTRSISSGPIHEFVAMDSAATSVQHALRVIGMTTAAVTFKGGDGDCFEFKVETGTPGHLDFYLTEEFRPVEVKTIAGGHMEQQKRWCAYALVMNMGSRDEPPYTEDIKVAEGLSPEDALIQALLVYFRNTLYDSLPFTEYQHDEDIPQ